MKDVLHIIVGFIAGHLLYYGIEERDARELIIGVILAIACIADALLLL